MTMYDVLCQRNKETEIVTKCRKLSSQPLCEHHVSALKRGKLAKPPAHSLGLPGGVWQARGCVDQIGRADFRSTLRTGLPSCFKQRKKNRAHNSELATLLAKKTAFLVGQGFGGCG